MQEHYKDEDVCSGEHGMCAGQESIAGGGRVTSQTVTLLAT